MCCYMRLYCMIGVVGGWVLVLGVAIGCWVVGTELVSGGRWCWVAGRLGVMGQG